MVCSLAFIHLVLAYHIAPSQISIAFAITNGLFGLSIQAIRLSKALEED